MAKYIIVGVVAVFIVIVGAVVLVFFLIKKNRSNAQIEKLNQPSVRATNNIVISEVELNP